MTAGEIGALGESAACEFLKKRGMTIVECNFHCRFGEIDIIALDGDTTVFAEVKTRRSTRFGMPGEFVDSRKQQKIITAALTYTGRDDIAMRFDVIEVLYIKSGGSVRITEINHIENAF